MIAKPSKETNCADPANLTMVGSLSRYRCCFRCCFRYWALGRLMGGWHRAKKPGTNPAKAVRSGWSYKSCPSIPLQKPRADQSKTAIMNIRIQWRANCFGPAMRFLQAIGAAATRKMRVKGQSWEAGSSRPQTDELVVDVIGRQLHWRDKFERVQDWEN